VNINLEVGNPADILLVEDRTSDVELMREALQECHGSYHLHVVMDGEAALAFLHQKDPTEVRLVPI
jgi:CheY-like chemotaxis protein